MDRTFDSLFTKTGWACHNILNLTNPYVHFQEKLLTLHLSKFSVIQLSGLLKCREDSDVHMQPIKVIFHSLGWISPESTVLMQLTQVLFSSLNWDASWVQSPRTSQKLWFSQLPNQHGTTWAVTSTAQWADCSWECNTSWPEDGVYGLMYTTCEPIRIQELGVNQCKGK